MDQWFSTRDDFAPLGDIWQRPETFLIVLTVGLRVLPAVGTDNPPAKNFLAQNVNSAKDEKPCCRLTSI